MSKPGENFAFAQTKKKFILISKSFNTNDTQKSHFLLVHYLNDGLNPYLSIHYAGFSDKLTHVLQ